MVTRVLPCQDKPKGDTIALRADLLVRLLQAGYTYKPHSPIEIELKGRFLSRTFSSVVVPGLVYPFRIIVSYCMCPLGQSQSIYHSRPANLPSLAK